MAIPVLSNNVIQELSKALGEAASGSELTRLFAARGMADPLGEGSTKWKRIAQALSERQAQDRCANNVLAFVKEVLSPVRHVSGDTGSYDLIRSNVNQVLAFTGIQVGTDGELREVEKAQTISQAQHRADRLRLALEQRNVHPDVLVFCRAELIQENYFHAILEATKSVAQKIRDKTGLTTDGSALVDEALNLGKPLLVWSTLTSDSEKSEQTGFGNMLKGMFSMFRNPTAHDPKILRAKTEQDALDLLMIVSFMHRRIDDAQRTAFQR